jgi:hypothetical protein
MHPRMLGGPVAFIATFFISAPVPALSAGGLYVFGTSIVDAGSTQNALGGPGAIPCAFTGSVPPCDPAPASFGYFDGRFSQGPNAEDLLNAEIEGTNSLRHYRGRTELLLRWRAQRRWWSPRPLGTDLFDVAGVADPNALCLINIGGNDVRDQVHEIAWVASQPGAGNLRARRSLLFGRAPLASRRFSPGAGSDR